MHCLVEIRTGAVGYERYNHFVGEIVVFEKCADHHCGLMPPDGSAYEDSIVFGYLLNCKERLHIGAQVIVCLALDFVGIVIRVIGVRSSRFDKEDVSPGRLQ